jgi:hypothetical protein
MTTAIYIPSDQADPTPRGGSWRVRIYLTSSRHLVRFEGIEEGRSYCPLTFFYLSSSSFKPDVTSL